MREDRKVMAVLFILAMLLCAAFAAAGETDCPQHYIFNRKYGAAMNVVRYEKPKQVGCGEAIGHVRFWNSKHDKWEKLFIMPWSRPFVCNTKACTPIDKFIDWEDVITDTRKYRGRYILIESFFVME